MKLQKYIFINTFQEFESRGINITRAKHSWSQWLCLYDSDGDGKTNGDELGDPCCTWNAEEEYESTLHISHPGNAKSVTSKPSCYLDGSPNDVDISVDSGEKVMKLSLKSNSCVCKYKIEYSYKSKQYFI